MIKRRTAYPWYFLGVRSTLPGIWVGIVENGKSGRGRVCQSLKRMIFGECQSTPSQLGNYPSVPSHRPIILSTWTTKSISSIFQMSSMTNPSTTTTLNPWTQQTTQTTKIQTRERGHPHTIQAQQSSPLYMMVTLSPNIHNITYQYQSLSQSKCSSARLLPFSTRTQQRLRRLSLARPPNRDRPTLN